MTTSTSSLFQAGLFRNYDFILSHLKQLKLKTKSLGVSKMWSTIFFTFKTDGDITKVVQIPVNQKINV